MTQKAWSHSALDDFVNCPRAFAEKRVYKSVVEKQSDQMIWGEFVHKVFEDRLKDGVVLPADLEHHEPFMEKLTAMAGTPIVEGKIALDKSLQPCTFFGKDVWYRGVIDFGKVDGQRAYLCDHKTGKVHSKFQQLKSFALHTFAAYPAVQVVKAQYYWTQSRTANGEIYTRDMIPALWAEFTPNLRQYAEAFKTDTWQPRPSGLCYGWCPVTSCEHWKPKKVRR